MSPARNILRVTLLTAALLGLGACGFVGFPGVYKIDIEQGNLVTQDMIEQLQPGMSRRQVRFIMGSPLVEDTFQPDRWDYPYVIRNGQDIIREAQVRIFFESDRLVNITGDYLPDWANPNATNDTDSDTDSDSETETDTPTESSVGPNAEASAEADPTLDEAAGDQSAD